MAIAFNETEQEIIKVWITNLKEFPQSNLVFINSLTDVQSQSFHYAIEILDSAEEIERHERMTIAAVMVDNDNPTVYVINNSIL